MNNVAAFAEQALQESYGEETPWIHQAVEVVRYGLLSAIERFQGRPVVEQNARQLYTPGSDYTHAPRSREEILADMAQTGNDGASAPPPAPTAPEPTQTAPQQPRPAERPLERPEAHDEGWIW